MKTFPLSIAFLILGVFNGFTSDSSHEAVTLLGVIGGKEAPRAVLSVTKGESSQTQVITLKVGERDGAVELLEVSADPGTATLRMNQTNLSLKLPLPEKGPGGFLAFDDVDLDTVLRTYAECSHRTILRSVLLESKYTVRGSIKDGATVASVLTNALDQHGIATILDGEKFAIMVPKTVRSLVKPHAAEIKMPDVSSPEKRQKETIPGGTIDITRMDIKTVIFAIYSPLAGAKGVDWPGSQPLPPLMVSLKTETSLTKPEIIYAFDTIFALNGLKVVPSTNGLIKVVASSER